MRRASFVSHFGIAAEQYFRRCILSDYCLRTFSQNRCRIAATCARVAFAPGVSAPQSLGLDPEVVLPLLKHVLRTRKVRGFDICEISPRFDQDNTTANLGAVIIFAVINTLCRMNGLEYAAE